MATPSGVTSGLRTRRGSFYVSCDYTGLSLAIFSPNIAHHARAHLPAPAVSPLQLLTITRLPAHNTRFFSGTLSKTPIFSLHILSAFSYKPSDTHSTW